MNSLLLLFTGFVFGLKHALEADHVLTVTTIISKTRFFRVSALLASLWGLGHTITLLAVGILVLSFKLSIPDQMAIFFELVVGVVLVVLGAQVLLKIERGKIHRHSHEHDSTQHTHFHSHTESDGHVHAHKPLLLGMLHGLAGSAALTILVLTSVKSFSLGLLYILVFGVGSIIGMIAVSSLVSLPFLFLKRHSLTGRSLNILVGLSSITLGIFTILQHSYILQKVRML